jgi:peptidyl-prolyl cis-trans isomerase A (cyclophilin A)
LIRPAYSDIVEGPNDADAMEVIDMSKNFLLPAFALALFLAGTVLGQTTADPRVLMKTSKGDITLELYPAKAPITVKNFLSYVNDKFYDGTTFHRVIPGFMIQGGGLTPDMHEKAAKAPIKNESGNGLRNVRGAIAMARMNDLNSATCQFYINTVDNPSLDEMKYCAFGKVVAGMDVVDAIAGVTTGPKRGYTDVPLEPVMILSVTVIGGK